MSTKNLDRSDLVSMMGGERNLRAFEAETLELQHASLPPFAAAVVAGNATARDLEMYGAWLGANYIDTHTDARA